MSDFHASDRGQPRSGFAAHSSAWSRTRLIPVSPVDDRFGALIRTMAATCNLSDGVQFAQLRIDADPELAHYFSHNLIAPDFFCHFFAHPDVGKAFPSIPAPQRELLGFCCKTGPEMTAILERAVLGGSAYRRFKGGEKDARKLVADFGAAIGDRFATGGGWLSEEAWSPWFCDVAWDRSLFWFDRHSGIATIFLTTDTD